MLATAKTTVDLERGLMCVKNIPTNHGMLFLLGPPERNIELWMKNTIIPLDMIFIGANGKVHSVAKNVPASPKGTSDHDVARRSGDAQYVIELAAGDAHRHHIVIGSNFSLNELNAKP